MKKFVPIIFFIVWLSCLFVVAPADAAFNLSVRPLEGGNDLRFGNISAADLATNKELIINITSSGGAQYQVTQTLLDPMTSAEGASLNQSNLFVSGIEGSNMYGAVRVMQEFPVSLSRTILYTSGSTGLSDSFRIVYSLKGPMPAGSYRGRIAFLLEPIGAAGSPVTVILNIFAEVSPVSSIEIKPVQGVGMIRLAKTGEIPFAAACAVSIKGIMGRQFRIFQALSKPFENPDGYALPEAAVTFSLQSVRFGSVPLQQNPLTQRQQVIYTSSPQGDPETFLITYALLNPEKYTTGTYRSHISYVSEGLGSGEKILGSFDFEIEIPRIFDLLAKPGISGIIDFRVGPNVKASQTNEVLLEIKSNIAKPYQVTQKLTSELINREGKAIPQDYFTIREESVDTKGTLKFPIAEPVKSSDTVLFVSDKQGSPDSLKIVYELRAPADVPAGDYSTSVVYSISEI